VLAEDGRLREVTGFFELSQLALAIQADVSTRHLSFVETGRSQPSRDLLPHLAEELDLPLRERNHLLLAAGYAPVYSESELESEELSVVRDAVRQVLSGHEPYPAAVVDRALPLAGSGNGT
jgi:transcriptional regulator with XRE-family HTH domain